MVQKGSSIKEQVTGKCKAAALLHTQLPGVHATPACAGYSAEEQRQGSTGLTLTRIARQQKSALCKTPILCSACVNVHALPLPR